MSHSAFLGDKGRTHDAWKSQPKNVYIAASKSVLGSHFLDKLALFASES